MTAADPLAPPPNPRLWGRIELPSHLEVLPRLVEWFLQFQRPPVDAGLWVQAETGLVEAFTNAVRHAHGHLDPPPPVPVEVWVGDGVFHIRVEDRGPAYDLEGALLAHALDLGADGYDPLARDLHWGQILLLKLRSEHGWQIAYHRSPGGGSNHFDLRHPLDAVPAGGAPPGAGGGPGSA